MANTTAEKGVTLEVLGTCMTNTTPDSQHDAKVEYRHLWSYAQQAALIAVSDKNAKTGCYELITDPERRAKRIAANYADLYFKSGEKTKGKMNFHWVALAAFVVKDIVEAYRFSREEVLQREWKDVSSVLRNSTLSDMGSMAMTNDSPYQHVLRTYAALAKGNLWLFMDVHPWMWFFLEYGINADGSLNQKRLDACLPERDWNTFQAASKDAVEELPFGPNWMKRLSDRLNGDIVYKKGGEFFTTRPEWSGDDGYGQYTASAYSAHYYCKSHVKEYDNGYRMPPSKYWNKFQEAYYIMDSEHLELIAAIKDKSAMAALLGIRNVKVTPEISTAYTRISRQYQAVEKDAKQRQKAKELEIVAMHEQINVLQPLIYDDARLKVTMDMNHMASRLTSGWLSPQFKVVYSFDPHITDPSLQTVFDASDGIKDRFFGNRQSLTNPAQRMGFVKRIAKDFNQLMDTRLSYMECELRKIQGWLNA